MILPVIAAALGADALFNDGGVADDIGEGFKDFSKVGTNNFNSTPYTPGQLNYGGYEGGAADIANIGLKGMGASNRGAQWAQNEAQRNRGAQAIENQELSNREADSRFGDQSGAIQLAREAAMGQAPSEAAYLMQQGLNQGAAAQASQAGSARGASAIAQAQGNAAGNTAALQQNAYNQGAALRAQEMATGRSQYGGLSGQQREQDLQRLGMGNQMSQFNANLNDQYRMGMGGLGAQYGNQGLGWYQASQNPYNQQLNADTQREGIAAESYNQSNLANAGVSQANADLRRRSRDEWVGMGGTLLQGARGMGGGGGSGGPKPT